jgi:hypothetical protein
LEGLTISIFDPLDKAPIHDAYLVIFLQDRRTRIKAVPLVINDRNKTATLVQKFRISENDPLNHEKFFFKRQILAIIGKGSVETRNQPFK